MWNLNDTSVDYECRWTKLLQRMNNTCIFKLMYAFISTSKRDLSQPKEQYTDQHPGRQNEIGRAYTILLTMMTMTANLSYIITVRVYAFLFIKRYFVVTLHSHIFLMNLHCGNSSSYKNQHKLSYLIFI